jgi:diacylglycerol kinase (ATP)
LNPVHEAAPQNRISVTSTDSTAAQPGKPAYRPLRAKLIFNAASGQPQESPQQLTTIIEQMQIRNIQPEVYIVRPESRIRAVARDAIKRGFKLVVVAGGDGTIDTVAGELVGQHATLGIVPTGTRNNVALSLGIPPKIEEAVALLRDGRRTRIDAGHVRCGTQSQWFLEAASVGLLSDLYPHADGIQHGDLGLVGELLATFVSATASKLSMVLDRGERLDATSHMVLVGNMPYAGPNYKIASGVACDDGMLDVLVYSDMSKLDLMGYAVQLTAGAAEDPRVKHYRIKRVTIDADPPMPVIADGFLLGKGPVAIELRPKSIRIMAGHPPPAEAARPAEAPAKDEPA